MQLVQQHARNGRIASRKEKTNNEQAYLMALETVLLHPLITKSDKIRNTTKRTRPRDSKSRSANSAFMQLVQQHARYGRIASRKEKTNNALAHT